MTTSIIIQTEKTCNHYPKNRNMKKTNLILLLLLWSLACHSQTIDEAANDTTITTEYNDGVLWLYEDIENVTVGTTCYKIKDYGKQYQIHIYIYNHSDTPLLFDPTKVSASLATKTGDTLQLQVYTNEMFQRKVRRSQTWAMALYGFSTGLSAGMAGYSTSYSTTYSPNGLPYTTVTQHYDANAAFQANMVASHQIQTLGNMMQNEREVKEQGYLKMNTIHPGECIVGYMNIKRKKGTIMTVFIPVNDVVYSFDWDVR
ncbi:hypothetical protein IMSAGC001_00930 [Bacteroides acidifaciens]|uniref:Uncharacterized protein n=2 Tax=Bacteroides acidifaciens TaxID=85831 RepID=A0A7J0A045_9BACE|nr:hypothetical protein IMSAGC001_00930 [Bacteroides acidifaciens]